MHPSDMTIEITALCYAMEGNVTLELAKATQLHFGVATRGNFINIGVINIEFNKHAGCRFVKA